MTSQIQKQMPQDDDPPLSMVSSFFSPQSDLSDLSRVMKKLLKPGSVTIVLEEGMMRPKNLVKFREISSGVRTPAPNPFLREHP